MWGQTQGKRVTWIQINIKKKKEKETSLETAASQWMEFHFLFSSTMQGLGLFVRHLLDTPRRRTQSAFSSGQLLMFKTVIAAEGARRAECLRLRVFKSLLTSHATAMCMHQYTCRAWEYWGERTGGMASRQGGGAHRGRDRHSNRKSFPAAGLQMKRLIVSSRHYRRYRRCRAQISAGELDN